MKAPPVEVFEVSDRNDWRRDLRKRGEKQMQQYMTKMMSNPDFMKAAGNAMSLMSRINQVRSKGVKPLGELMDELERQVDRLQKKARSMGTRLDEIEGKLEEPA